jgi:hypothetical protein
VKRRAVSSFALRAALSSLAAGPGILRGMRRILLLCATALLGSTGCGINTDPTIFVDAKVETPTVNVSQKALGTSVTGGFTLSLHLGARAVGPAQVNVQSFQLLSEDQKTVEADSLPLKATGRTLPITIDPDTDLSVPIEIDLGSELLSKDVGTKLCSFGTARYSGSITDSLRGGTVPVLTDPVPVKGCMAGM